MVQLLIIRIGVGKYVKMLNPYFQRKKMLMNNFWDFLEVQWLIRASTAGGTGSIPGWGTKLSQAVRQGQNFLKTNNNEQL